MILELLRQLGARLREWREQVERVPARTFEPQRRRSALPVNRRAAIEMFIQRRHPYPVRLADLAKHLHLSESRAGHAVQEACGVSFVGKLSAARLDTAAQLLRHTNLAVLEVATRSGFGDLSNFHLSFRRCFGLPPHQYRKRAQAPQAGRIPV